MEFNKISFVRKKAITPHADFTHGLSKMTRTSFDKVITKGTSFHRAAFYVSSQGGRISKELSSRGKGRVRKKNEKPTLINGNRIVQNERRTEGHQKPM